MGNRFFTPVLIAVVCFALSCDEPNPTEVTPPPSDQQFAVTTNEKDVEYQNELALCGDWISVEGTEHWVIKRTETPSGRIQWSTRTNYKGTAVGTPSGHTWKLNGQFHYQEVMDGNDGLPFVAKYQQRGVFVGLGQTPNMRGKINWHVTVNPAGDWVVDRRFIPDPICQGN
ncbi:MAG: hypothetical protein PVJ43_13890 [Gemmatimonadales bacterium]|jgi:hypothetical protein